jgi:hypothetical protein
MKTQLFMLVIALVAGLVPLGCVHAADNVPPEGFVSLFNGKDLGGWKVPEGDNGHWKVVDGRIDCDIFVKELSQ